MIFNSIRYNSDSYVNESEFEEILEFAPNRFEHETIGEATAIIIGEQEVNWGRLMVGVGMSELHTVQEGLEFVNEAGHLKGFFDKAIAFFKMAINKLAEITKAFIAKIDQFIKSNDSFIKNYKKRLEDADSSLIANIKFKGYKAFNDDLLDSTPQYKTAQKIDLDWNTASDINIHQDDYKPESAKASLVPGYKKSDNFNEAVVKYLFGNNEKEEFTLSKDMINKAISIINQTANLKKNAKNSYTSAAKQNKDIIKSLENAVKNIDKVYDDNKAKDDFSSQFPPSIKDNASDDQKATMLKTQRSAIEAGYKILTEYWKSYSQGCQIYHGTYLRALSTRNHQAKAMCVKVIQKAIKGQGQNERNDMRKRAGMDEKKYNESYISTDAFLGAVEFI